MSYKFAHFIVWCYRLFFEKGSHQYYKLTYLMEDITNEEYRYHISLFMNRTWDN